MSDRRAVSAGHLAASSVAAASESWRVAVGGNRVQSMTVEQIAQAFQAGQLNVRTPLWPPGTSGWQALGNFEQFQMMPAGYGGAPEGHLSQFEEADDDPTRMWTGTGDLDMQDMHGMAPPMSAPPAMMTAPVRPSSRTGPRQVSAPPSRQPYPMAAAAPVARMQAPTTRVSAPATPVMSSPAPRQRRGSGLLLVAGLVGLVGLGSAVLAARGSWSVASTPAGEASPGIAVAPVDPPADEASEPATQPTEAVAEGSAAEVNQARLAKYEDGQPSAFVAGSEPAAAKEPEAKEPEARDSEERDSVASKPEPKEPRAAPAASTRPSEKRRAETSTPARPKATAKAATPPRRSAPPAPVAAAKPKAEPAPEAQPPANSSVNEAAAAALATSANLAASCRPSGGPSGQGKARIIYSQDGDVQSVEILTAKFRDTLTGSCVRMVFRRAKIPAFKGEPPTFIKSFTIPEE
jgi:uncharacterized protein DUF4339